MPGRRMIARSHLSGSRSEPFEVFTRPQRSLPARVLGLALRLRTELVLVVTGWWVWSWLTDTVPTWAAITILGILVVAVGVIGPTRRYTVRRGFAVLTRHRLRAVFIERRVMNYTGNLPVLLWSRPTPVGERVWLVLRAGIDLADLERNLDYIASGCLARDARASAHRSVTALCTVDVVRRDPLSARPPLRPSFTTDTTDPAHERRPALRLLPTRKGA